MAMPNSREDREYNKFVEDASGNTALRTAITVQDIEIGAVEIKDSDSDTRVEVNDNNRLTTLNMGQLVPEEYDYLDFNYTDDDLTEIIYKTGGAGGSTVATLTLTYSGGKLNTITKS